MNYDGNVSWIKKTVGSLRRRGAVVATSGGVDSAVVLGLCTRALGSERVISLFLPERDSTASESRRLAKAAADAFGCRFEVLDISGALEAIVGDGSTEILKRHKADFDREFDGYAVELNVHESINLGAPYFDLAFGTHGGDAEFRIHPTPEDLRMLISHQNVKQRLRMTSAYHLAEGCSYAVAGTSNRDEAEFGFCVKYGDAAGDFFPIIEYVKSDVYRLADAIGVPQEIRSRTPTTDTYSLRQSQEKFFFGVPAMVMRLCARYDEEATSSLKTWLKKVGLDDDDRTLDSLRLVVKKLGLSGDYVRANHRFQVTQEGVDQ